MSGRRYVAIALVVATAILGGCLSADGPASTSRDPEANTPPPLDVGTSDPNRLYGHNQSDDSVDTPEPLDRKTPRTDVNVTKIEVLLAERLNEYRQVDDAQPLVTDPRLAVIARNHSYDMATRDFFNHTNPDGVTYDDRLRRSEYLCAGGAENIQATFWDIEGQRTEEGMAESLLRGFMGSAPHNTAMIRPDYTTVGIGIYITADRRTYVTMALCDGNVLTDGGST